MDQINCLFNENHRRAVRIAFQGLDALLTQAVHTLDGGDNQPPFSELVADTSPAQRDQVNQCANGMRTFMRLWMDGHRVEPVRPYRSAAWEARATLMSAQAAVEELRPQHLRGGGDLTGEAQKELDAMVTALTDCIGRMDAILTGAAPTG